MEGLNKIDIDLETLIPRYFATNHMICPISLEKGLLKVGFLEKEKLENLNFLKDGLKISKLEYLKLNEDILMQMIEEKYSLNFGRKLGLLEVKEALNMIYEKAIKNRVSDLHFVTRENEYSIDFRIDGEILRVAKGKRSIGESLLRAMKVTMDIDTSQTYSPQEGRTCIEVDGNKYDLRVSLMPTILGESMTIRFLQQSQELMYLENLGMDKNELDVLKSKLKTLKGGLILVVGATGSGKTTTIYSILREILKQKKKVISLEDPVEYIIPEVVQVQMNETWKFGFSEGIKHILRQDPDVIFIGEIRDEETAKIAIEASNTGHIVISSLHGENMEGSIQRLKDLGISAADIKYSLKVMIFQELKKKYCIFCENEANKGCEKCGGTGFLGRTGNFNLEVFN